MPEKNKGVHWIHVLWIIGLLEADSNSALKFYFTNEMMGRSEKNGLLDDEQWVMYDLMDDG